jgi:hypothetical protein
LIGIPSELVLYCTVVESLLKFTQENPGFKDFVPL